jgi:hypothetical protein
VIRVDDCAFGLVRGITDFLAERFEKERPQRRRIA